MNVSALRRLTLTELRLNLRDWSTTAFGLVIPLALLGGLAMIPGVDEPDPAIGGRRGIDTWVPSLSLTISIAMLAWFVLPTVLATYRERGVLRRLATTPAGPAVVLAAQFLVNLLFLAVSLVGVVALGRLALGMNAPVDPLGLAFVLALGVLALFGVGLLLAATLPHQRAATGVGWLIFAPSAFLAGIYVPIQFLPDWFRAIADHTPLAAFRFAMEDAWVGAGPHTAHVVVLALTAALSWLAAVRFFRHG
jgi:ABC-2 type transport system permease protein